MKQRSRGRRPRRPGAAYRCVGTVRRGRRTLRRDRSVIRIPPWGAFRDPRYPVGAVPRFAAPRGGVPRSALPRRGRRPRRPGVAYRSVGTVRRGRRTLRWGKDRPRALGCRPLLYRKSAPCGNTRSALIHQSRFSVFWADPGAGASALAKRRPSAVACFSG